MRFLRQWRRMWLVVAVVVLAAGATLALVAHRSGHSVASAESSPAAGHSFPRAASTAPPRSVPFPSSPPFELPVRAWGATLFADQGAYDLVGAYGSLYASEPTEIVRLDPKTGAVLARVEARQVGIGTIVAAGGAIWTLTGPTLTVRAFAADTLRALHSVPLGASSGVASLAAGDGYVLVGAGDRLQLVDASTGREVFSPTLAHVQIHGVAIGAHLQLYATTTNAVYTVFMSSGRQLREPMHVGGDDITALSPAANARWLLTVGGIEQHIFFQRLSGRPQPVGTYPAFGGGGYPATMSRIGDTMWLGGDNHIVCAAAGTGQVRAAADVVSDDGSVVEDIFSITRVGDQTFALAGAHNGSGGIVRLHPPAACDG